jgi:hypothetical protein
MPCRGPAFAEPFLRSQVAIGLPAEEEKPAPKSRKRKQAEEGEGEGENQAPAAENPAPPAKEPAVVKAKKPRVVKGEVKPFEAAAVELKRLVWIPWGKKDGRRKYWPGVILTKQDMRDKLISWPSQKGECLPAPGML